MVNKIHIDEQNEVSVVEVQQFRVCVVEEEFQACVEALGKKDAQTVIDRLSGLTYEDRVSVLKYQVSERRIPKYYYLLTCRLGLEHLCGLTHIGCNNLFWLPHSFLPNSCPPRIQRPY